LVEERGHPEEILAEKCHSEEIDEERG